MSMPEAAGDVLIVGGSGVLAAWVVDLLSGACRLVEPPGELVVAGRDPSSGQQTDVGAIGGPRSSRRLLVVRYSNREILEAIEHDRATVVGIVDDPIDSVRYLMTERKVDLLTAMREQTAGASAFHLFPGRTDVLIVRRGIQGPARGVAEQILAQSELPVPGDGREALLAAFCGTADAGWSLETALSQREGYQSLDQLGDVVATADASLILQVLTPLVLGAVEKDIGTIVWPGRAFYFGDRPNEPAPPVVDLTGSQRIIFYGPYFHVPPGIWSVKILLAFTDGTRGLRFVVNIISNLQVIARAEFQSTGTGIFEGAFEVRHSEPHQTVEINLISVDAAIDGHISLGQMTFTKVSDLTPVQPGHPDDAPRPLGHRRLTLGRHSFGLADKRK